MAIDYQEPTPEQLRFTNSILMVATRMLSDAQARFGSQGASIVSFALMVGGAQIFVQCNSGGDAEAEYDEVCAHAWNTALQEITQRLAEQATKQ